MARRFFRTLLVGIAAILLVGLAVPAYAQLGSLRGKVIDETGKGVPDAEVVLDFVGDFARQLKAVTDKNGEWIRAGMPAGGGTWNITIKKGTLVGTLNNVKVALGEMTRVADVTIKAPGAGGAAAGAKPPAGMSADEVAKRNKRQNELKALFDQANAAVDAGQYDDAIAKLTQIAGELEKCAACYARMGDVYLKKNDLDNAEKSYLKAIDVDPAQAGAYGALASLYNQQKKLDEAAKMSAKALELMGDSGDASQVFNQGVIFWNQSKVPEAKAMFEKAAKLDPKMADAHYWLGMALVNEGKLPDAKAPFQEYLKLAPSGQYAATAKAILDTIK
jgi:tetratricopeptide (TPR) repeat protein